jgi:hypothetical protein
MNNRTRHVCIAVRALRKRSRAPTKNTAPMAAVAANSGHTMSKPAPRYRMAWAKLTKCVDGEPYMTVCKNCGMLSSGVLPPESRFMTMNTGKASSANWGMERARVARKMLSEVTANR